MMEVFRYPTPEGFDDLLICIDVTVKLDFLKHGVKYEATIYADAPEACGLVNVVKEYNPYAYTITKKVVTSKSVLKIWMQACGGFAVSIREKK